jgi:hypothetical protein
MSAARGEVARRADDGRGRATGAAGAGARPRRRDGLRWECRTCGQVFTAWAPAERHADEHHGARIVLVFP